MTKPFKRMTVDRMQVLLIINELCKANDLDVAHVKDVIAKFDDRRKPSATRKLIVILHQAGFLENPMFGRWRLTDKGKNAVSEYT